MSHTAPLVGDQVGDPRQLTRPFGERVDAHRAALDAERRERASIGSQTEPDLEPTSAARTAGLAIVATATFGTTTLIALLVVALIPTVVLGWAATVIESGSMQPTVVRGDIVVLRPLEGLAGIGSVVRFPADDGGTSIVHRVVDVDLEAGAYVTKGDANPNDDQALVPFAKVDGLGAILVPLVGHPSLWFREGRHLLLAALGVGGAGVIWAGVGVGRRSAGSPEVDAAPGSSGILTNQPLGIWSIARPSARPPLTAATEPPPGRVRSGPP